MAVGTSGLGCGPNRSVGVGLGLGLGLGFGCGFGTVNVRPAENSEVLKRFTDPAGADGSAVRLVAVAVTTWPDVRVALKVAENDAVPLPSVVTLTAPRKVCPSGMPPAGSALLAKN